jgi:hypothetical protein
LPRVLRDHPELAAVGRLTLLQSLQCVRMVLWEAAAHFLSRNAYPHVGHEQKDGCPTKSGVVISSLANKQSGIGPRLTTKPFTLDNLHRELNDALIRL